MKPDQIIRWLSPGEAHKFLVAPQGSKPMFVAKDADSVGVPTHERLLQLMRQRNIFDSNELVSGGFCVVEGGEVKFLGMSSHPVVQLARLSFYQMIRDEKREINLISMGGEIVEK